MYVKSLLFIPLIFLLSPPAHTQSVAIIANGLVANTSSILDIKSVIKGLLNQKQHRFPKNILEQKFLIPCLQN